MMNLSIRDRATLAKLLALAGSTTHDGETVTAMKKADELVKARGASWQDVLLVKPVRVMPQVSPNPAPQEREHVSMARDLLHKGRRVITRWEREFLTGILTYRALTPSQLETLALISRKVSLSAASAA